MFEYPSGTFVGDFVAKVVYVSGLCTDTSGDVYVVGYEDYTTILKYAHGATEPTSTINLYGYDARSCAVDPTTGNLAVYATPGDGEVIAIYPQGSGTPTFYTVPDTLAPALYCTYDDSGNLFADITGYKNSPTFEIAELPAGGSTFSILKPNRHIRIETLQWLPSYLAAAGKGVIYHLVVSGSSVRVIGETKAKQARDIAWIQDSDVLITPYGDARTELGYWDYPKGGKVTKIIQRVNKYFRDLKSVVVSTAESR